MNSTPRAAVDRLGGGQHLVGRRRGEHLARAGGVQHAEADEAGMQRLVAGAAAGDQRDLARFARSARTKVGSNSTRSKPGVRLRETVSDSRSSCSTALMNFFMSDLRLRRRVSGRYRSQTAPIATWQAFDPGVDVADRALAEEVARGPWSATMSRVASMPRSASSLTCAHSAAQRRSVSARRSSSRATGISTSSMVFSPTSALPRELDRLDAGGEGRANCAPVALGRPGERLPMRQEEAASSGPEAPPIVVISFMPMRLKAAPCGSGAQLGRERHQRFAAALDVDEVVAVADRAVERLDLALACQQRGLDRGDAIDDAGGNPWWRVSAVAVARWPVAVNQAAAARRRRRTAASRSSTRPVADRQRGRRIGERHEVAVADR